MRPPPTPDAKTLIAYPVTASTAVLAVAATAAWWAGLNLDPLVSDSRSFNGEPWRLVTSSLLHLGLLHLVFNLYWLWVFGTLVEENLGHLTTAALFLWLAAGSDAVAGLFGEDGVGLSGVGYGLFGFLFVLKHTDERFDEAIDAATIRLFVIWFFLCIALSIGDVLRIGNIAHGAGAALGALAGLGVARHWRRRWCVLAAVGVLVVVMTVGFFCRPQLNFFGEPGVDDAYLAYRHQQRGQYPRAIELYQRAVTASGKRADWWYHLGRAYAQNGQHVEAESAFERAFELIPSYDNVSTALTQSKASVADLKANEGDYQGALQRYQDLIILNASDDRLWFNLGCVYRDMGIMDEARQAFRQAIKLNPDEPDYRTARDKILGVPNKPKPGE